MIAENFEMRYLCGALFYRAWDDEVCDFTPWREVFSMDARACNPIRPW